MKVFIFLCLFLVVHGITNFTGTSYQQNFNSLTNEGKYTNAKLPFNLEGWSSNENFFLMSNGHSLISSGLYSFGRNNKTIENETLTEDDRSLGSYLGFGNNAKSNIWFGLSLLNVGNRDITKINISFWGEQWKTGASKQNQVLFFFMRVIPIESYKKLGFGQDVFSNSTWIGVNELNFQSLNLYHRQRGLDGKLPTNRKLKNKIINLMSAWSENSVLQLKWQKIYLVSKSVSVNDDALAIDDLNIEVFRELDDVQRSDSGALGLSWKTWTILIVIVVVIVVLLLALSMTVVRKRDNGYSTISG